MSSILIAEPDGMMAKYFKAVIEGLGYAVCGVARTTEEAAELAQQTQPDLMLVDDRLPGAGDSVDLVHQVNLQVSGDEPISFVFVTAIEEPATLARIKSVYPSADVLLKPVRALELYATLARLCPPDDGYSGPASFIC